MRTPHLSLLLALTTALGLSFASGCSTLKGGQEEGKEISASGPTILNARTNPETIELTQELQPTTPAEILADVKDFNASVTEVRLRFTHVPIEVPMQNVGGTTWRAVLSPRQLQLLAVNGRTMNYEANILAKDDAGRSGVTEKPLTVAVSAPELAQTTG